MHSVCSATKKPKLLNGQSLEFSLNYIKQNRLKERLRVKRCLSMEMLHIHEYGIPLVRVNNCEGPHVFTFLIPNVRGNSRLDK